MINLTWSTTSVAVRRLVRATKACLIIWLLLFLCTNRPPLALERIPASRVLAVAMVAMLSLTLALDLGARRVHLQRRTCIGILLVVSLLLVANLRGVHEQEIMGHHSGWWTNGWPRPFLSRYVEPYDSITQVPMHTSRWAWNAVGVTLFEELDLMVNAIVAISILAATAFCLESNPSMSWAFPYNHGDAARPCESSCRPGLASLFCLILVLACGVSIMIFLANDPFRPYYEWPFAIPLGIIAILGMHTRWRSMIGCVMGFAALSALDYYSLTQVDHTIEHHRVNLPQALLLVGSFGGAFGASLHAILLRHWIFGGISLAASFAIFAMLVWH